MQNFTFTRQILTTAFLVMAPIALSAQENKKEVHLKIVEDGVVTKDTVYSFTGESPEIDHFTDMVEHRSQMEHMHMKERHMMVMNDSAGGDFEWSQAHGEQKDVKVIIHEKEGQGRNREVEEIWIDGNEEGRPCKTIIIHEGDCPGMDMEKEVTVIVTDGQSDNDATTSHPGHDGEKPGNVKRKVVKSDGGTKVMIIETTDDTNTKKEDKSK